MKRFILFCSILLLLVSSQTWAGDYIIGDGDSLNVAVWGVAELSAQVVVRPDGKITLPAVGDVVASGLTPEQLGQQIAQVLSDYVKNPVVTVTVVGITNNRIYIAGSGVPPRVLNLNGRTSLFKMLCGIDGIVNADLQRATLLREGKKIPVDMEKLFNAGDITKDVTLKAGDIIFLPSNELNKVYVVGAVTAPQAIKYRVGLRILDVILESGGFTKFANTSAVLILRKKANGKDRERIKVNMDDLMKDGQLKENIELQRGDYVLVRESMF